MIKLILNSHSILLLKVKELSADRFTFIPSGDQLAGKAVERSTVLSFVTKAM